MFILFFFLQKRSLLRRSRPGASAARTSTLSSGTHYTQATRYDWGKSNFLFLKKKNPSFFILLFQESQVQNMSRLELEREAASLAAVAEMR